MEKGKKVKVKTFKAEINITSDLKVFSVMILFEKYIFRESKYKICTIHGSMTAVSEEEAVGKMIKFCKDDEDKKDMAISLTGAFEIKRNIFDKIDAKKLIKTTKIK